MQNANTHVQCTAVMATDYGWIVLLRIRKEPSARTPWLFASGPASSNNKIIILLYIFYYVYIIYIVLDSTMYYILGKRGK